MRVENHRGGGGPRPLINGKGTDRNGEQFGFYVTCGCQQTASFPRKAPKEGKNNENQVHCCHCCYLRPHDYASVRTAWPWGGHTRKQCNLTWQLSRPQGC